MSYLNEEWTEIKGFEGLYEVSSYGNVRSLDRRVPRKNSYRTVTGRIMAYKIIKEGYKVVNISKNSKQFAFRVNRLVAEHFVPNPDNKKRAIHLDGDKQNNYFENLMWMDHSQFVKHFNIVCTSDTHRGETHTNAVLKENEVEQIIDQLLDRRITQKTIAAEFNVSEMSINHVSKGKSWSFIRPEVKRPIRGR